jgi:dipeptidyl aminopeptidase/acylaminoacyl peptidase
VLYFAFDLIPGSSDTHLGTSMQARHTPLAAAATLFLAMSIPTAIAQSGPSAAERIAGTELIPREALFGNPERALVQISPDGKYLSWIAPVNGVMNVWVAPDGDMSRARAVTNDEARGIRRYFWSYQPGTLLYLRDTGGDEDFHLYGVDVATGKARDLTPFEKTTASVVAVSHGQPGAILVGMNDRDAKWHDLYRVDLATGKRTLVDRNEDEIGNYLVDDDYTIRYATRSRPDGATATASPRPGADGAAGARRPVGARQRTATAPPVAGQPRLRGAEVNFRGSTGFGKDFINAGNGEWGREDARRPARRGRLGGGSRASRTATRSRSWAAATAATRRWPA